MWQARLMLGSSGYFSPSGTFFNYFSSKLCRHSVALIIIQEPSRGPEKLSDCFLYIFPRQSWEIYSCSWHHVDNLPSWQSWEAFRLLRIFPNQELGNFFSHVNNLSPWKSWKEFSWFSFFIKLFNDLQSYIFPQDLPVGLSRQFGHDEIFWRIIRIQPVAKIYRSVQLLLNIVVVIVDRFNSRRWKSPPSSSLWHFAFSLTSTNMFNISCLLINFLSDNFMFVLLAL